MQKATPATQKQTEPKVPKPHEDLNARIALHKALQSTPDVTLGIAQAALFLGVNPTKLERWRNHHQPPHPVGMNGDERGGYEVRYRVGELQDFLRKTMPSEIRIEPEGMKWFDGAVVQADEIEEPFFMDSDGLVLAHGWEDSVSTIAERLLSPSCRIDFMSWDNALACVWQDEVRRLSWLGHSDNVAPGLRAAVESKRQARLATI